MTDTQTIRPDLKRFMATRVAAGRIGDASGKPTASFSRYLSGPRLRESAASAEVRRPVEKAKVAAAMRAVPWDCAWASRAARSARSASIEAVSVPEPRIPGGEIPSARGVRLRARLTRETADGSLEISQASLLASRFCEREAICELEWSEADRRFPLKPTFISRVPLCRLTDRSGTWQETATLVSKVFLFVILRKKQAQ